MVIRCNYKRILETMGLREKTPPPRVFVSLNIFNAHRPSGLSQPSTRVIARVSIWTLLVLLLTFMIIYTIILVYVDNTFLQKSSASIRYQSKHRKTRLNGRFKFQSNKLQFNSEKSLTGGSDNTSHRKAVWNSSKFYNDGVRLPQCKRKAVFRVLVASTPKSQSHRRAIRNTWCKPRNFGEMSSRWHCIFLIGLTVNDTLNAEIRNEQEIHRDMLIGNYYDSYDNLTLKIIHGFNWSVNYCQSSYIVKADEDVFVNTALLHNFLLNQNNIALNLYTGRIIQDQRYLKVKRRENEKWFVPYEDFAEEYYYPYASGMGYIVSRDVAQRLVQESAFIKPIINEDAYMGIVIHRLGVEPTTSGRFVLSPTGLSDCNLMYLLVIHDVQPENQKNLLEKALRAERECQHHSVISTWS